LLKAITGRFFSCVLDEEHLWAVMRYVERNPVRAGLVAAASDYRWSSASAHCRVRTDPQLVKLPIAADFIPDWAVW
jgi:putative transposase